MNAPPRLCPNCGTPTGDAPFCRNCGFAPYGRPYPYRRRSGCVGGILFGFGCMAAVAGLAIALLVAFANACANFPNGPQRQDPTPTVAVLLMILGGALVVGAVIYWLLPSRTGRRPGP